MLHRCVFYKDLAFPSVAAALALGAVALPACAPPRPAETTLTGAAVSQGAGTEGTHDADGPLACKAKTPDRTQQLFLSWKGDAATGVLRTAFPSGMIKATRVTAERYKGMIVVDDPHATDLVDHLAILRESNGKKEIQMGDWKQSWSACE